LLGRRGKTLKKFKRRALSNFLRVTRTFYYKTYYVITRKRRFVEVSHGA
jgi:hypothetical protein